MPDWTDIASRASQGGGGGSTQGIFSSRTSGAAADQAEAVPMVYLGKKKVEIYRPGSTAPGSRWEEGGSRPSYQGVDKKVLPADEVSASWYDMDDQKRREFADYLVRIGVLDPDDASDYDALQEFWEKGIQLSSGYTARGKDVTPREALAVWAGWDGSGQSDAARRRAAATQEQAFTGSRTSRSRSVNLSDAKSAQSLANYVLSKALGREALPEEIAAYKDALNDYEKANPSVSKTTVEYEDGLEVNQKTTTRGGATAAGSEQVLTDMAREDPDFAEYQAAGPVWNSFLAALASPVSMG